MLAALFLLSQGAYYLKGVRFDASPLPYFIQFLDQALLRHRLAESLLYLHSQPPLFNLFLGIVIKLFPGHEPLAFQLAYLFVGLSLYLALHAVMRRLGISSTIALVLSTWFIVSPSFIVYENLLFYPLLEAALLILSALLFFETVEKGKTWQACCLFGSLFLLCGVRSAFHLFYYLSIMAAMLLMSRGKRKMILLAASGPLLLLSSLYIKNFVLFGQLTTSSWIGMNLWGTTGQQIPLLDRQQLVAQGKLSPVALVTRFMPITEYPQQYLQVKGFENIAALRQATKSGGEPNFNHLAYVAISKQYLTDSLHAAAQRPLALLKGVSYSWAYYFESSCEWGFLYRNLERIKPMWRLYDYLFYGKVPSFLVQSKLISHLDPPVTARRRPCIFLLVGFPILVFAGLRFARGRSSSPMLSRNQRWLIVYICFNIIYVAAVGNLFEMGENHRFRFVTDPLYVALLGLLLNYSRLRSLPLLLGRAACLPHRRTGAGDSPADQ